MKQPKEGALRQVFTVIAATRCRKLHTATEEIDMMQDDVAEYCDAAMTNSNVALHLEQYRGGAWLRVWPPLPPKQKGK